ncbi:MULTISPECIES: hypothetical protein [unclassified Pedobacter]|nr:MULTISPECIES: hypothetical protein [unclassified Pedobacter]
MLPTTFTLPSSGFMRRRGKRRKEETFGRYTYALKRNIFFDD